MGSRRPVSVTSEIICNASSFDNEGKFRPARKASELSIIVSDLVFSLVLMLSA